MTLVDTSVWIATFRGRAPLDLDRWVPFDEIVTCLPVVQEVLEGFRDETACRRATEAMCALPVVESPLGEGVVRIKSSPYEPEQPGHRGTFHDELNLLQPARAESAKLMGIGARLRICRIRRRWVVTVLRTPVPSPPRSGLVGASALTANIAS